MRERLTVERPPFARIITLLGIPIGIATAGLMGYLSRWEDGPRTQNVVYADRLAGGLPTACKGITHWTSPVPVTVGEHWSDEKCERISRQIVERTQVELAACITAPITQPVFDALTSAAHNLGVAAVCASRFLRLINAGRIAEGCHAMAWHPDGRPAWAYVDRAFIQGLHTRRLSEMRLCLQGVE